MSRVLMVGIDPDEVDFSDPSLPPGLDADKIRAGIEKGRKDLNAAGHDEDQMFVKADPKQLGALAAKLAETRYDAVIIGGGVRVPPSNLALFEAMVNLIAASDGPPKIALVSGPEDAANAVNRALA